MLSLLDPMHRFLARSTVILALLLTLCFAACSAKQVSTQVETFPVKGKVVRSTGQPPGEGLLELSSADGSGKVASSPLAADGTFELTTLLADGTRLPGAEPGEYRAMYVPKMSAAQTELPEQIAGTVRIEPQANDIELRLP